MAAETMRLSSHRGLVYINNNFFKLGIMYSKSEQIYTRKKKISLNFCYKLHFDFL